MPRKSPWILLFALAFAVPTTADDAKLLERLEKLEKLEKQWWDMLRSRRPPSAEERKYPVADLAAIPGLTPPPANDRPVFRIHGPNWWRIFEDNSESQQLIDHLTRTIEPSSWLSAGGGGTIDYDSEQRILVVNATPEVHEQIPLALAQLEQGLDRDVVVEVQTWRIPAALAQHLADAGIPCNLDQQEVGPEPHILCLPDHCLKCLMERVQQDCQRGVVRNPKITLLQDRVTTPWETLFCLPLDEDVVSLPPHRLCPGGLIVDEEAGDVRVKSPPRGLVLGVQPLRAVERHPLQLRLKLQTAKLALFGSSHSVHGYVTVDLEGCVERIPFSELIPSPPVAGEQCLDRIVAVDQGQTIIVSGWKLHDEPVAGVNGLDEYLLLLITPRWEAKEYDYGFTGLRFIF